MLTMSPLSRYYRIGHHGVRKVEEGKVSAITEWAESTTVKERKFLQMI